jgi:hypothetical protein
VNVRTRFGGDALIACRTEERALMKHDRLVYDEQTVETVQLRDKATGDIFKIPKKATAPALRRFAYASQFEMTDNEDFVVVKHFPRIEKQMSSILGEKKASVALEAFKKEWASVVESGSSSLCLPGRIDLAAPGTRLLAVRGNKPIFMCSFMWGISGLSEVDEKITVLWLNSAIFFYLLLARQTVTRGSWVKLHGKQLMRMQTLDVTKLSESSKNKLIRLYDELLDFKWFSILDQYSSPPKERIKLDSEILKILGVKSDQDIERTIHLLYDAITSALKTMQTTMEAD